MGNCTDVQGGDNVWLFVCDGCPQAGVSRLGHESSALSTIFNCTCEIIYRQKKLELRLAFVLGYQKTFTI